MFVIGSRVSGPQSHRVPAAYYELIAQRMPCPVFVFDADAHNVYVNEAFSRLVGRPTPELLGDGWKSLLTVEQLPLHMEALASGMARGEPFMVVLDTDDDGRHRQYEIDVVPLGAVERDHPLWVGTIRNLTRQRHAEAQATDLSDRYRNIIQRSPVVFMSADEAGQISFVDASEQNAVLRGWVGRTFQELTEGEPIAQEGLRRVIDHHQAATRRVEDGGRIYQVNWYPRVDLNGVVQGVDAVASDVTERVQFDEQLRVAFDGVIGVLGQLTDIADPYTQGHEESVADIAEAIARELQIEDISIEGLRVAARLHDIGKVAVPPVLLARPGLLSDAEFNLIKTHVDNARRIFADIEFPWPEIEAIYEHHERLNGSGYPLGLTGDQISQAGRILMVADVCDAMTSHRPYRPARSREELVEELRRCRGIHFDERVVDVAIELVESGRMPFRQTLGSDRHGEVLPHHGSDD